MRTTFFLSTLILFGVWACSDNAAPPAPLLQVHEPTEGQTLKAGGLLPLNATVSDETGLEAVVVNLEGGEGENSWFVTGHSSQQLDNTPTIYILDEILSIPDTSSIGAYTLSFYIRNREGTITESSVSVQIMP